MILKLIWKNNKNTMELNENCIELIMTWVDYLKRLSLIFIAVFRVILLV